ncbi:hypothetical protein NP233_g9602 [Leucocoprinus birnbaumii]|uniref:Fungal-type protein kinase domain-containing protein n=1 Tax=Leucocoprinus birnbaumii TaxID=56174 RepID=A0AAD5VKH9_9AGAR|nr:hypothetical protein NP233_g9602 [Leucocoprinus birnbaumii]
MSPTESQSARLRTDWCVANSLLSIAENDTVCQSAQALVLMFLAGWVHRDANTGNIVILEDVDGVQARQSGFELARKLDSEGLDLSTIEKKRPVYMPRHDLEPLMVWVVLWVVLQLDFTQAEEALPLVFVNSSTPCDARWDFFRDTDADTVKQVDAGFHPALSKLDDAGSFVDHFTTVKARISDLSTTTFNNDPSQAAYLNLYWNVWRHFTGMLSRIQSFDDPRMVN